VQVVAVCCQRSN